MESNCEITEAAIMLKPTRLYRRGMSAIALYDISRGVWRVSRPRAGLATIALIVIDGEIIEVYQILGWHRANTTPYLSGREDQSAPQYTDRFEFTGQSASTDIRDKYFGKVVKELFGRGQVVRYLNWATTYFANQLGITL